MEDAFAVFVVAVVGTILIAIIVWLVLRWIQMRWERQSMVDAATSLTEVADLFRMRPLVMDHPVVDAVTWGWDDHLGEWCSRVGSEDLVELPSRLRLLTFNLWFSTLRDPIKRCQGFLLELQKLDCDVVALQEVQARTLELILKDIEVRRLFVCSTISINQGYGVAMLVKRGLGGRFLTRLLPSHMRRSVVYWVSRDGHVAVATSHLESLRSAPVREAQLECILPILKMAPLGILIGDMNMDAKWPESIGSENILAANGFTDAWQRTDDPGYTHENMKRIDRCFTNAPRHAVEQICVKFSGMNFSDHHALMVDLALNVT